MSHDFSVWVGCMGCYNAGFLVGEWEAAEYCPQDIEELGEYVKFPAVHYQEGHEEIWCFDTEYAPISGEMDPMTAQKWGEELSRASLDSGEYEALRGWLNDGYGDADYPYHTLKEFEDKFRGIYSSMEEFCEELLTELGEVPGHLIGYIDWELVARDYRNDFVEIEVSGGRSAIFWAH